MHASRKRRLVLIGTFFVAVAIALVSWFEPQRSESWQVWTVVHGDSPSQGGETGKSIASPLRGPIAFALDLKGCLVVADSQAGAFVTWAPDGSLKGTVKVTGARIPSRIEVDETGLVYGVGPDRKSVVRYNPDGSSMPVFSQATGEVYFIEGIGVFGSGTLYVQDVSFQKDRYTRKLTRVSPGGQIVTTLSSIEKSKAGDSKVGEKVQIPVEVDDFVVSKDGTLVVVSGTQDPYSRTVTRIAPSGKTARFTIREKELVRRCRLLGVDSQGNIFIGMSLGKEPRVTACRYDPAGHKMSEVSLKGLTGAGEVSGRVDAQGNIYISRDSDTGFCIDKYSPKSELKWVPRILRSK